MPHALTKNLKKKKLSWSVADTVLKCHLFLLYTTTKNHFSTELWHVVWNGFYMTTSDDQLSGWMVKKLQSTSQNQTCTQKMSWSLFDGLLLIWSTIAFWIRVKPLPLRSMLSKLMRCTENGNTCSQHWSTEKAQFFSTTMSNHTLHNQHAQSGTDWATNFTSSTIFTWPLTNQLPLPSISITFCRENASTTSRRQKMLFKSSSNPEAQIFML